MFITKVDYDATGVLEKNRDRLPVEIVNMMRQSGNSVVQALFLTPLTRTGHLWWGQWGQWGQWGH